MNNLINLSAERKKRRSNAENPMDTFNAMLKEQSDSFWDKLTSSLGIDKERINNFIEQNQKDWIEEGELYKQLRENMGISINKVAVMLGTSPARIQRFESGEPVMMSKHLKTTYTLLFNYLELKSKQYKDKDI